jgi:hypothetical protein
MGEAVGAAGKGSTGGTPVVSCQIVPAWLEANARLPAITETGHALE